MSRPRFLFDENIRGHIVRALRRRVPEMDYARIGDVGFPTIGATDPEILEVGEK